jgi:hypothetical protein
MKAFDNYMDEYKKQLKKGDVQKAYQGLMDFIQDLRNYLNKKYPDYNVSGSIYFGYMDMTYFSFFPESLKSKKLKVGIVFIHESCSFEAWLFGYNKNVQNRYWKLIKDSGWKKYQIPATTKGVDYIIDHVLIDDPDFSDPVKLTKQIEKGTLKFIKNIENFLSEN